MLEQKLRKLKLLLAKQLNNKHHILLNNNQKTQNKFYNKNILIKLIYFYLPEDVAFVEAAVVETFEDVTAAAA